MYANESTPLSLMIAQLKIEDTMKYSSQYKLICNNEISLMNLDASPFD